MLEKIKINNNITFFDGISLKEISEKYETPVYIYSKNKIIENYNAYLNNFKNSLNNFLICYAIKSNDNLSILKILASLGSGADTVSANEIEKSIMAGITPDKIVYSGVGKSDKELEYAIEKEISQINVESFEEYLNIENITKKLNKRANVSIRINPNIDAGTHEKITTGKKENKFGNDIKIVEKIIEKAKNNELINLKGLSVHIGSQILNVNKFEETFIFLKNIYLQHPEFKTIDIGGGLGIQYKEEDNKPAYDIFTSLIEKHLKELNIKIIVEPGRSITGDAGIFLTKVNYVKKTETKNFVVVDGGMNNLIRPAMYDAYHHPVLGEIKSEEKEKYDIVGPICESSDVFVKNIELTKIEKGDLIAFLSAGAYGRSMSSNYNLHDIAGELLIDNGKIIQIRKPISFKDLLKFEE